MEDLFLKHKLATFFDFNSDKIVGFKVFHVQFPLFSDFLIRLFPVSFSWLNIRVLVISLVYVAIMHKFLNIFVSQFIRVSDFTVIMADFGMLTSSLITCKTLF